MRFVSERGSVVPAAVCAALGDGSLARQIELFGRKVAAVELDDVLALLFGQEVRVVMRMRWLLGGGPRLARLILVGGSESERGSVTEARLTPRPAPGMRARFVGAAGGSVVGAGLVVRLS